MKDRIKSEGTFHEKVKVIKRKLHLMECSELVKTKSRVGLGIGGLAHKNRALLPEGGGDLQKKKLHRGELLSFKVLCRLGH